MSQFDWIKEKLESPEWRDLVFGGMSYPTQILVNEYRMMDGIATHFEDEDAFGPIIATISLLGPTMMVMQRPKNHDNDSLDLLEQTKVFLTRDLDVSWTPT